MAANDTHQSLARRILLGILLMGLGLGLGALYAAERDAGLIMGTVLCFGGIALVGAGIGSFFGGPYRWAIILVAIGIVWALVSA